MRRLLYKNIDLDYVSTMMVYEGIVIYSDWKGASLNIDYLDYDLISGKYNLSYQLSFSDDLRLTVIPQFINDRGKIKDDLSKLVDSSRTLITKFK